MSRIMRQSQSPQKHFNFWSLNSKPDIDVSSPGIQEKSQISGILKNCSKIWDKVTNCPKIRYFVLFVLKMSRFYTFNPYLYSMSRFCPQILHLEDDLGILSLF